VTDEGLHQAIVEMGIQKNKDGTATVWTTVRGTDVAKASRFANHRQAISFVQQMERRLLAEMSKDIAYIEQTGAWWL